MKGLLAVVVLACAVTANGALLTEDWENMGGGQKRLVVNTGVWVGTYPARDESHGRQLCRRSRAGQSHLQAVRQDRADGAEARLRLPGCDPCDQHPAALRRFQTTTGGTRLSVDAGLARIGQNNGANYVLHYWTTALQTVTRAWRSIRRRCGTTLSSQ